jgi:opacity protein-like surface antigen
LLGLAMVSTSDAGPYTPPAPGPAPVEGGPYLTIAGGALWLDDASAHGISLDFDTGFSIMAALGYGFGNGLAVELESGYMEVSDAEVSGFGFNNINVDGEFRQIPILVNAVYNCDITDTVGFYIGAGAGVVWSEAEVDAVGPFNNLDFSTDDWNFAAQAKAGVSFHLNESTSLNIGYRFLYGQDAVGGQDDSIGHILEGGVTFRF